MSFKDRSEAGRKLAKALAAYKDQHPVILALPRGGVPVAAEVGAALHAPLDLILVRKIGVPIQPELAMRATRMRNPKKLVLAVPVAPTDSLAVLRNDADDIICLEDYEFFGAIGFYYRNFNQIADEDVIEMLKRFPVTKLEQAP